MDNPSPKPSQKSDVPEINIGQKEGLSPLVVEPNLLMEALLKSGLEKQESKEEKAVRLEKVLWEFRAVLGMKVLGFVALIVLSATSFVVILNNNSTAEAKGFAEKTITGIVGAVTGFSIGKGGK